MSGALDCAGVEGERVQTDMKRLFTMDLKNYEPGGRRVYRPSVRGIILRRTGKLH